MISWGGGIIIFCRGERDLGFLPVFMRMSLAYLFQWLVVVLIVALLLLVLLILDHAMLFV